MRLAAALLCVLLALPGLAADARIEGGILVVNEVEMFRVRTTLGGLTAARRSEFAVQALIAAPKRSKVEIQTVGAGDPPVYRLSVQGRGIVTIDEAEAKAHGTNPRSLAVQWAQELDRALALSELHVKQEQVVIPSDGSATITVIGSLARKAQISVSPEGVVKPVRSTGKVKVFPLAKGATTVTIAYGPYTARVPVSVLAYAAQFPLAADAEVMGSPATAKSVKNAAQRALMLEKSLPPGATIEVLGMDSRSLSPGQSTVLGARIRVDAPGHFPATGKSTVTVRCVGGAPDREEELWYSNEPENVGQPELLYWNELEQGRPARILIHHRNRTGREMVIRFGLMNPGSAPVQVGINMGDSEPSQNPTLAGYQAGKEFADAWADRQADLVTIPPRSVVPLVTRKVGAGVTMSALGSLHVRKPSGGKLILVGESVWLNQIDAPWRISQYQASPWDRMEPLPILQGGLPMTGSKKLVYEAPHKEETFTYRQGGPFAFVRVGQNPITSLLNDPPLLGNFGVHYHIAGTMTNPTDRPAPVEVVFESSAGYSGAFFTVNGRFITAGLMQPKDTIILWEKTLQPGESQPILIRTIPLSGASYPATITVKPKGVE